jgi:hypothetical protein
VDTDPRSVFYWIQTFLDETLSLSGKLPRTLGALVVRPGLLTLDWQEGRRNRWAHPFRLYLLCAMAVVSVSVVFPEPLFDFGGAAPWPRPIMPTSEVAAWIESAQAARGRLATTLLIVLVPIFALLLKVFGRRGQYYVDHLVHALHLFGFAFLLVAVLHLFKLAPPPWENLWTAVLPGGILLYLTQSNRRIYKMGLVSDLARSGAVLMVFYLVPVMIFVVAGNLGAVDPRAPVDAADNRYWEVRDLLAEGTGGDEEDLIVEAIVAYERLEAYQHTPLITARLAELYFRRGGEKAAMTWAREALVRDPGHLLALGWGVRAAKAEGEPEIAADYGRRYQVEYPLRVDDEEFRPHGSLLQEILEEADAVSGLLEESGEDVEH